MLNAPAPALSRDSSSDPSFNDDDLNDYSGDESLVERSVNLNENACLRYVARAVEGYSGDRAA